ncbi:uncharacterized protein LOC134563090 [Prinia subflava]|uniref:uncharacterized protein LOC134563090 n=1 Tax=Prinia subflava TaxID=208062 RepID=UPI002FE061CF
MWGKKKLLRKVRITIFFSFFFFFKETPVRYNTQHSYMDVVFYIPHMGHYLLVLMLLFRPGYGIKFALLVYYAYCMTTSEAMNVIWNIYSILFACPSLGCYIWGLYNHIQSLWGGVKNDFFQPFRPDTAVLENIEFSLDAKDSIVLLLVLLCLLCTACNTLRNKALHGVVQRLLEEEEKRSKATASMCTQAVTKEKRTKSKATASVSTQTVTEEEGTKSKATVSVSTQTVTEEEGTKCKATVSVSTQDVTEEEGTKGAISISTQTVTELEQPKPVAVAPVQKKKTKRISVRIVTDEDVAGPSHPAEETEPEIITRSLSLGELHDLQSEFTCQTNKSILTWLLHIWDAAANDTLLDGSEAKQLGSLSRDVVIDQGIGGTQGNSASGGDC